jgi:hypothetical protein
MDSETNTKPDEALGNGRSASLNLAPVILIFVICGLCVARLTLGWGDAVSRRATWTILEIFIVFSGLELLSVSWNLIRGKGLQHKNLFDYVADALGWLPWP